MSDAPTTNDDKAVERVTCLYCRNGLAHAMETHNRWLNIQAQVDEKTRLATQRWKDLQQS